MNSGTGLISDDGSTAYPNLLGHFRKLARFAVPALLVAALVGVGTYFALSRDAPVYRAWVTAQVDAQIPVVSGDGYLYQMTGPYIALAVSEPVQVRIAERMGPEWTPRRVASSLAVNVDRSPWLLNINATAPTRHEALQLVLVSVQALDEASKAHRLAERAAGMATRMPPAADNPPLDSPEQRPPPAEQNQPDGINGLSVLAAPSEESLATVQPPTKTAALFAMLVTFICAAEAMVWASGRFGRRLTRASAERITGGFGAPLYAGKRNSGELPPVVRGLAVRRANAGHSSVFLASPGTEAAVRDWVAGADATLSPTFTVITPSDDWVSQPIDADSLVILTVAVGEKIRSSVLEVARTLHALGHSFAMALIWPQRKNRHARVTPAGSPAQGDRP